MGQRQFQLSLFIFVCCIFYGTSGFAEEPPPCSCPNGAASVAEHPANIKPQVNLNEATRDELQYLPRVGPSKADAIIAYRTKRPFRSPHELMRIRGIGRKTFRKLSPFLTVKGPTTAKQKLKLKSS